MRMSGYSWVMALEYSWYTLLYPQEILEKFHQMSKHSPILYTYVLDTIKRNKTTKKTTAFKSITYRSVPQPGVNY